uniref:Laminin N-terminal domain-containing protein n=1 Tax=Sinocyclocheilus grahami TaxID=75366 RepID=A0A672R218_SINGR
FGPFLIATPVCLQDECVGNSCYPNLGDLMVGRAAQLTASSTCGLYRPQNYCILGYLEVSCRKCNTLRVQFSQKYLHYIFPSQTTQNSVPSQRGLFSAPTLRLKRDGMLFFSFFSVD